MKYDLLAMFGHKGKAAFEEIKNKDDICNTLNMPHYHYYLYLIMKNNINRIQHDKKEGTQGCDHFDQRSNVNFAA